MKAAHAHTRPVDPQSGPSRGERTSHFHLGATWIVAEPGRIVGLQVSNYINRLDQPASDDLRKAAVDRDPAVVMAAAYIARKDGDEHGELGAHVLIGRGLPVRTGKELARLLDARERKADRTYRCYGGRLPRVATHVIASFRYGVTPTQAEIIASDFARVLSDRLQVPIEGQVHNKNGRPDHIHLLIGTRVVVLGKLGKKCRALDAVSEKADGQAIKVGDRLIGATMEWMRSEWAARMRDATGDMTVDHRSYARRNLDIVPVTYVPRADIEYERRRGTNAWQNRRQRELATRVRVPSGGQPDVVVGPMLNRELPAGDQAIELTKVERRAHLLLGMLAASTSVEKHDTSARSAADELAKLLGLAVPGAALSELLHQRERAGRRAAILFEAIPQATSIRQTSTTAHGQSDEPTDLLGLQQPGGEIQDPSCRNEWTGNRLEDEAHREASTHPQEAVTAAGKLAGMNSLPRSLHTLPPGLLGPTIQPQSHDHYDERNYDPDTDGGREPLDQDTEIIRGDISEPFIRLSSNVGSGVPALEPSATVPPAPPPIPPIDVDVYGKPIIAAGRLVNRLALPIGSARIVYEGAGVGRLDQKYAAKRPAHGLGFELKKPIERESVPAAGGRTPETPASTTSLERSATRSTAERQTEIQLSAEPHPDQHHAIFMFHALRRQRRLTASRVQTFATSVNMDRSTFEALAVADSAPRTQDDEIDRLPPHLSQIWRQWAQEDNEARRLRRAQANLKEDQLSTGHQTKVGPSEEAKSNDISPHNVSALSPAKGGLENREQESVDQRDDAPKPAPGRLEPCCNQPMDRPAADGIEPPRAPRPDPIDRALVGAFAHDVRVQAGRKGKVPAPRELERGIAIRLRVTGRSCAEVEAVLVSVSNPIRADLAKERISEAVAHAFSDSISIRIQTRAGFVAHIETIETKSEAHVFRHLRRQALDKFRLDLDAVWVERRMRADEAARRHARRMKLLHDLRWRTDRARRRSPIVVAILSALVEIAVIRPLITRQQARAIAERRAIYDAAEQASNELKRLRQEWREQVNRTRGPGKSRIKEAERSAVAPNFTADANSRVATLRPDTAGEHRQMVIRTASVMAAAASRDQAAAQASTTHPPVSDQAQAAQAQAAQSTPSQESRAKKGPAPPAQVLVLKESEAPVAKPAPVVLLSTPTPPPGRAHAWDFSAELAAAERREAAERAPAQRAVVSRPVETPVRKWENLMSRAGEPIPPKPRLAPQPTRLEMEAQRVRRVATAKTSAIAPSTRRDPTSMGPDERAGRRSSRHRPGCQTSTHPN